MYDIIIIGAGPGGYIAAERAGSKNMSVLLIEKSHLGGVCLNEGCIPTKTLLNSAKIYSQAKKANDFGVNFSGLKFDLAKAMSWKQNVIETLRNGVAYQMKRNNVEVITGTAQFADSKTIKVNNKTYTGNNIIIATGSSSVIPPIPGLELNNILKSREILNITKLPGSLSIIGGGVIGMEFASLFSNLGTDVHVIEMLDEIIPIMDRELSKAMRRAFKNITFNLSSKVIGFEQNKKNVKVKYLKNTKTEHLETEYVLLSVGRRPNVEKMGFEKIGLDFDNKGIKVDNYMQTNLPGVYAIGDVTGKLMLAHAASKQGLAVADIINNEINEEKIKLVILDYGKIPACTFTNPEIGSVGFTEQKAKEEFHDIIVGKFPFSANGKALSMGSTFGFVKTIADSKTNKIIGMHIIGPQATELIALGGILLGTDAAISDVKKVIFAHPTLSETVMESIEDLEKLAIHKI